MKTFWTAGRNKFDAGEWLKKNFVSLREKNTADNFREYLGSIGPSQGKSSRGYDP
jgi:hypothetical protein